jgi:cell division protease FtsH
MIAEQYERAKNLLQLYAKGHGELTNVLTEREVIFTEDVEHIFGPRPWASRSDELLQQDTPAEEPKPDAAEPQPAPAEPAEPQPDSNNNRTL